MKKTLLKSWIAASLLGSLVLVSSGAYSLGETAGNVPNQMASGAINQVDQSAISSVNSAINSKAVNWQTGNYGVPPTGAATANAALMPAAGTVPNGELVFGEQIFTGGFSAMSGMGLNATYKVAPGDQIILRAWGAINIDSVLPVDAQGNIFIPTIGPVSVVGVSAAQVSGIVSGAVKAVYPNSVNVYTQLQGVQPVSVFVTGFVNKPGRFAGKPSDSLLYFMDQAQGIDKQNGSFRKVSVVRDRQTIAEADLYDFLISGSLPSVQFKDGDTIVVHRRGSTVVKLDNMTGVSVRYELANEQELGASFLTYSPNSANVSHVLVQGSRNAKPFSQYLTLDAFRAFVLTKDDQLAFTADERAETILVRVEGTFLGRSSFVLPKDVKLSEVLNNIPVDKELTDTSAISIRRLSVAAQQKASLDESLRRLENTYLTASSATSEEASIRVKETEMIQNFVQRAAQVKPNGRIVVADTAGMNDIRLQDGDIITIPARSDSILISGQVLMPRALVFKPGMSVEDCIAAAGGLTDQADPSKVIVLRQSGEVVADASAVIKAGDEVMILPKVSSKNIQLTATLTQILYQIAIAARVVMNF